MKEQKYLDFLSTCEAPTIEPDSSISNGDANNLYRECRICLQQHGPFIIPCKCQGTMKYVHEICLKKWAAQKIKKQAQKDEQKGKGKLASYQGVECQLCNQTISMQVRKNRRLFGCREAKQNSQDHFLPFCPLLMLNVVISSGCFSGFIWILAFSAMLIVKSQSINYHKYLQNAGITWGLLGLGGVLCLLFLGKSLFELYHLFVREQYEIIKVLSTDYGTSCLKTESIRMTIPDFYHKNKNQFNPLETMATPTSPHKISDIVIQNKLSITRQKQNEKEKIARQNAKKKLAKLKQFKAEDQKTQKQNHQSSTSSVLGIQKIR